MPEGNPPRIDYKDLIEHLSDPSSDLDFYLGYMLEFDVPGQMVPDIQPNPKYVTDIPPRIEGGIGMGLANAFMRDRRHRAYRKRLAKGWTGHRIVSEGDSWFQYPTKLQDIIDHLMKDHAILSLGAAGDELSDIQRQREIIVNLKVERASALLLSGGGNDLFDNGQMGRLVETPFPGATADDLVGAKFDAFLRTILGRFLDIFTRVHAALPHVHILVHGYGPAFPRGGDWIEKPLTKAGVPAELQHDVVKIVLKRFNTGLSKLTKRAEFDGKIQHLDVTDIGTRRSDWHDEIHLNGPNASKVADRFRSELRKRLTGPVPESGASAQVPLSLVQTVAAQAETLSAFDNMTLLRELDLRVSLVEMDATVGDEPQIAPLAIGQPMPELGLVSLGRATRRLIRHWEADLRDLICGGTADNPVETAILEQLKKGKNALSGAIAAWMVTGPLAIAPIVASALAAWLASKLFDLGRDQICAVWTPDRPEAPYVLKGAEKVATPSVGDMRRRLETPSGMADLSADGQKAHLENLDANLAKHVIEKPTVPVDAAGTKNFRKNAATILKMLGGDTENTPLSDAEFGQAEAFILRDGSRPAPYIKDGFVDLKDPLLVNSGWLDKIKTHEDAIRRFIASSGRILRGADRSADSVYGTAWMVEGGRIATARHVLEGMAIQSADGTWHLKDMFFVDFGVEADRPSNPDTTFRISGVDWAPQNIIGQTVDPAQLDAAVLTLEPVGGRPFPEPLPPTSQENAAAVVKAKWFINVGYPAQPWGPWLVDTDDGLDSTISKALLFGLVGDKFGVKRLAPGRIDFSPGFFKGDKDTAHIFTHDATTFGGNSGSATLSLTGGASICGLHFAGLFGTRNYAHFVPKISNNWAQNP